MGGGGGKESRSGKLPCETRKFPHGSTVTILGRTCLESIKETTLFVELESFNGSEYLPENQANTFV